MIAADTLTDLPERPAPPVLERVRGMTRVRLVGDGGMTWLAENFQSGSAKVRFPKLTDPATAEVMLLNTAGGLTGGDRISFCVTAEAGARAIVTTQAAERIYRRSAGDAEVETALVAGVDASLDWLPQETILFDQSSLRRKLVADVHPTGRLLAVEAIVLGRAAMGERVRSVNLADSWRVRRGGTLVFADGMQLHGDSVAILDSRATGGGAAAMATVLLIARDAESALPAAREALHSACGEAGASAWNGMLVARLLAADSHALRADLTRLIETLRGTTMPRAWLC
jgi:urease accessory protein